MKNISFLILSACLLLMVGCKTAQNGADGADKPPAEKPAEFAEKGDGDIPEDYEEPTKSGEAVKPEQPAPVVEEPKEEEVELNDFGMPSMLEFDETIKHLGEVRRGEVKNLTFKYKNKSKEVVEIELVTACSCTTSDFHPKVLQPGEEGRINLVFDSTNKDHSETIDVDIILMNTDPINDYPIVERVQFDFELKK